MKPLISATIQFGMATIPVGVASSIKSTNDPSFKTLHADCHQPVSKSIVSNGGASSNGYYCNTCKKAADETVHGYEYVKGEFVWFSDDEMVNVKPERTPVIELSKFVKATSIKPMMVEKHYFLMPSEFSALADPYGQLYAAMAKLKVSAIGVQTLWGKEHPCAVVVNQDHASGGVLMLQTLQLYEDLVEPDFSTPVSSAAKKKAAEASVASLVEDFAPEEDLISKSRERIKDAIAAKIEGREIEVVEPVVVAETPMDIGEALKVVIAERSKAKTKTKS